MKDNIKHIICGIIISLIVGLPVYLETSNLFGGLWAAGTSGLIAGGIKEWCDNLYDNEWSWSDFKYTSFGVIIAIIFIILLNISLG